MKKNRILAIALMLALMIGIIPAHAAAPRFSDVPADHWAYSYVEEAAADGAVNGVGGGKFSPGGVLTVAEWSCILARAFYGNEVEAKAKTMWYNREVEVLQEHHILGFVNDFQLSAPASRVQMAETVAKLLKDKNVTADASKVAAAKAEITDLDSIYPMNHEAVATCWALGIINGVGGGRFDGNSNMERAAASAVYSHIKKVLGGASSGPDSPVEPTAPPTTESLVGTMSSVPLDFREEARTGEIFKSHASITDYWSQQSEEIRRISDKDSFNAACQTIKDSEMILTQGEFNFSTNICYNYAIVPKITVETQKNVDGAMGALEGYGGSYGLVTVRGYTKTRLYTIAPLSTETTSAPRFASAIAQINANPSMTDRQKAELCVKAVCEQIDYVVDGGASWGNGKNGGDCTSYARMLNQILSAAGLPNMNIAGPVAAGKHAWVQIKLDGEWYIMDGTITEGNPSATVFTFAEHESAYSYSGVNDRDAYKVARALIDAAYPG